MSLCESMDVTQKRDPPSVVQALMRGVPGVKIAAHDPRERISTQAFDDFSRARAMRLVRPSARGGRAPERPIQAIVSPARFIGLHRWARADRGFACLQGRLRVGTQAVHHLDDLSHADVSSMPGPVSDGKASAGWGATTRSCCSTAPRCALVPALLRTDPPEPHATFDTWPTPL